MTDIVRDKTYVVVKVDEPDDRQFWSNDQGWVDLEDATRFSGAEIIDLELNLPVSGGWIEEENVT